MELEERDLKIISINDKQEFRKKYNFYFFKIVDGGQWRIVFFYK
jgi:predicted Zn-dependent protease